MSAGAGAATPASPRCPTARDLARRHYELRGLAEADVDGDGRADLVRVVFFPGAPGRCRFELVVGRRTLWLDEVPAGWPAADVASLPWPRLLGVFDVGLARANAVGVTGEGGASGSSVHLYAVRGGRIVPIRIAGSTDSGLHFGADLFRVWTVDCVGRGEIVESFATRHGRRWSVDRTFLRLGGTTLHRWRHGTIASASDATLQKLPEYRTAFKLGYQFPLLSCLAQGSGLRPFG